MPHKAEKAKFRQVVERLKEADEPKFAVDRYQHPDEVKYRQYDEMWAGYFHPERLSKAFVIVRHVYLYKPVRKSVTVCYAGM